MKREKNILFMPSGSIGDALMMLVLCAEILERSPDVKISVLVNRNAGLISQLASRYPRIEVVAIHKSKMGFVRALWWLMKQPRLVLMPLPFWKGFNWVSFLFIRFISLRPGTRVVGLLKRSGDISGYSKAMLYEWKRTMIDNLRMLATEAGIAVAPSGSRVQLNLNLATPAAMPKSEYVVLHFFGSSTYKTFPPRRCRQLLQKLINLYPSMTFVLTAAAENEKTALEIMAGLERTVIIAKAPILEVGGLIQKSSLYIGVDTGITHLAGVLNHPSVVLTHNTDPTWKPYYNPNAIVLTNDERCTCSGPKGGGACHVYEDGVPYMRCLYDITDEQILGAVEKFVSVNHV